MALTANPGRLTLNRSSRRARCGQAWKPAQRLVAEFGARRRGARIPCRERRPGCRCPTICVADLCRGRRHDGPHAGRHRSPTPRPMSLGSPRTRIAVSALDMPMAGRGSSVAEAGFGLSSARPSQRPTTSTSRYLWFAHGVAGAAGRRGAAAGAEGVPEGCAMTADADRHNLFQDYAATSQEQRVVTVGDLARLIEGTHGASKGRVALVETGPIRKCQERRKAACAMTAI